MTADFNSPTNATLNTLQFAALRDNISAAIKDDFASASNIPDATWRRNPTTGLMERYRLTDTTWYPLEFDTATSGAANIFNVTLAPGLTLTTGMRWRSVAHQSNTTAATMTVTSGTTSLGSISIKKRCGTTKTALVADDIINSNRPEFEFDGTDAILLNPANPAVLDRVGGLTTDYGASSTAKTTAVSCSIPGGALGTYRAARLKIMGDLLNNSGVVRSLTIGMEFGGSGAIDSQAFTQIPVSASRQPFWAELVIQNDGATNKQLCSATLLFDDTIIGTRVMRALRGNAAVDSTVAKNLLMTIQWGTSDANLKVRPNCYTCELL